MTDYLAEANVVLTPGAQGHLRMTGIWGIILSIIAILSVFWYFIWLFSVAAFTRGF